MWNNTKRKPENNRNYQKIQKKQIITTQKQNDAKQDLCVSVYVPLFVYTHIHTHK